MNKRLFSIICPTILFFFLIQNCLSDDFIISDITCPIPKEQRIYNKTGVQCVWASLETLGEWCGEPKLKGLTQRAQCKGLADPSSVKSVLNSLDVKFYQSYGSKEKGIKLIEWAIKHNYPCLFGANRSHAMALLHYDREGNRVNWTDNSDGSAKTRQTTIAGFERFWDTWVCVIIPDDMSIMNNRKIAVRMWYNNGE